MPVAVERAAAKLLMETAFSTLAADAGFSRAQNGRGTAAAHQPARASRLRTVLSCQAPPRAVRTPRSFNAVAIARNLVAPAACIWRTIGSTLAAKASAASLFAATPLACASGRLVRFPRTGEAKGGRLPPQQLRQLGDVRGDVVHFVRATIILGFGAKNRVI